MSDLEMVRQTLTSLDARPKEELARELVSAYQRIIALERLRDSGSADVHRLILRRDLYARRCDLIVAIGRDDEEGLSPDKLNAIAAIIWPAPPPDPTLVPTTLVIPDRLGATTAHELMMRAQKMMQAVMDVQPPGFELGPDLAHQWFDWQAHVRQWSDVYLPESPR